MNNVLDNIEAIRRDKGLKQQDVAEKLGISQPSYSRYFSEQKDMKLSTILQISDILKVSLIDIVLYPKTYNKLSQAGEKSKIKEEYIHDQEQNIEKAHKRIEELEYIVELQKKRIKQLESEGEKIHAMRQTV